MMLCIRIIKTVVQAVCFNSLYNFRTLTENSQNSIMDIKDIDEICFKCKGRGYGVQKVNETKCEIMCDLCEGKGKIPDILETLIQKKNLKSFLDFILFLVIPFIISLIFGLFTWYDILTDIVFCLMAIAFVYAHHSHNIFYMESSIDQISHLFSLILFFIIYIPVCYLIYLIVN